MTRRRIVSGMRPTGRMHLGHLHGALLNWKKLQEDFDCFYFIADWHALTSEYAKTDIIRESTYEILIDWISMVLTQNPPSSSSPTSRSTQSFT